jgi:hypothetical protein
MAGVVWTQIVTVLWVVAILILAASPLDFLALWAPWSLVIVSVFCWLTWRGITRGIGRDCSSVAILDLLASWSVGTAALIVLALLLLGG